MRYGSIPGVGDRVSRLVLGSMVFSTEPKEFDNTCRLLDRFTAAGGTTVDTARIYARGSSESAFGQWLDRSGRRQDVIVLGKAHTTTARRWSGASRPRPFTRTSTQACVRCASRQ